MIITTISLRYLPNLITFLLAKNNSSHQFSCSPLHTVRELARVQ